MSTPGWETMKENAAPLQRGRSIATLDRAAARGIRTSTLLQAREDDSEARIAEFEGHVRPSEAPHITHTDEDPLIHWMNYIKYYQDNFPSDTHQQFLLMERCTRALVKMPQYANDDRFISICAKYADKTKEPGQVFKYLHQQKVGAKVALFWVAWAYVAEKDNDFPFAEQIYKKGLSKEAQPINVLKIRHKQFQRRMSRHWLSASQRNDELDEYEDEESSGRSTLGGLSQDRSRRNDQTRTGHQSRQRNRMASVRPIASRVVRSTGGAMNNGTFNIFVENEGENAPKNFLDQPIVEHKRVLEREADRRKENIADAERWNERGGLPTSLSNSSVGGYLARPGSDRAPSRGAPLPFAVFVDEECELQHTRQEVEKTSQAERHRAARDDRTFRERSDEGMVERLTRDPLRYVRDPNQFDADLATAAREQVECNPVRPESESDMPKRSRVGFNKKLLKDGDGLEQSFEEARARSKCYTLAPSSVNFNSMRLSNVDQSSQMDLDDGASTDVSMTGSSSSSQHSPTNEQPRKMKRIDSKTENRVLFRSESTVSVEGLNQPNISTVSSTVNESDAVGVPTRRDEETINTKLAMRELSMMFSSPAFGVDEAARRTERHTALNESAVEDERGRNISFGNVGDGLEPSVMDNSILNLADDAIENIGPRNPYARTNQTPGFEKMALREIKSIPHTEGSLACRSQISQQEYQRELNDSDQLSLTGLHPVAGFQIHADDGPNDVSTKAAQQFAIFDENCDDQSVESKHSSPPSRDRQGFQIYEDFDEELKDKKPSASKFTVYEEDDEDHSSRGERALSDTDAQGDTATFSLLGDTMGNGDFEGMSSSRSESSPGVFSEQGDTATLSVFKEVFGEISPVKKDVRKLHEALHIGTGGGFSIFVDDDAENVDNGNALSPPMKNSVRDSTGSNAEIAIDYNSTLNHNTKMALRRLQSSSSVASNSRLPLLALLSVKGKSFHLPHISLPRELRSKHLSGNTKVHIGKHSGTMRKELGRGAYGVVALMDLSEEGSKNKGTIAVKAQSPTDCLAWECEILRKLESRAKANDETYGFPCALSFLSLADGAIFSMTSGSNTGLNLVDLANVYKLKLGEHVPEIIALHYVSRMLRHLERLHWHGKILHCDVKPDNIVMCTLGCEDNIFRDIEFSDIMLVDFGRAIDMEDHCAQGQDARSIMFRGDACLDEMKCVAMRSGNPWSYDIDTFGVLACAHVMLYGSHIKLKKDRNSRWSLVNSFKRYWQRDLWTKIFETLLNLDEESGAAIGSRARSLRSLREEITAYTEKESDKLRSFLTRQLSLLPTSRDQLA